MQVSCPQCQTRLQLSAEKLPDQPFLIQCPKCGKSFTVSPSPPATPENMRPAPTPTSAGSPSPPLPPEQSTTDSIAPPPAPPIASSYSPQLPVTHSQPPPQAPSYFPAKPPSRPEDELLGMASGKNPVTSAPNMAVGWTQSMPTPTATEDGETLLSTPATNNDLLQALVALLSPRTNDKQNMIEQRRQRHIVACMGTMEDLAKLQITLEGQPYNLIVPHSIDEVTTMLQSGGALDILLLDPAFQADQQGSASIMRCVNMLNPARRRRLYVVVISHTYRTLDAQTAFAHGVNLIVNSSDLVNLPAIFTESIQSFNNLYRAYNLASGMSAF